MKNNNKMIIILFSLFPLAFYVIYYLISYNISNNFNTNLSESYVVINSMSCFNTVGTLFIIRTVFPFILGVSFFYLIIRIIISFKSDYHKKDDILLVQKTKNKLKISFIVFISILVQTIVGLILHLTFFGGKMC